MNLENLFHHEEHRDHEDFLLRCMTLGNHQNGESDFWNNSLLFFAAFVPFVVQLQNL